MHEVIRGLPRQCVDKTEKLKNDPVVYAIQKPNDLPQKTLGSNSFLKMANENNPITHARKLVVSFHFLFRSHFAVFYGIWPNQICLTRYPSRSNFFFVTRLFPKLDKAKNLASSRRNVLLHMKLVWCDKVEVFFRNDESRYENSPQSETLQKQPSCLVDKYYEWTTYTWYFSRLLWCVLMEY